VGHATLLTLLDRQAEPTVIVDDSGSILAASSSALEALAQPGGEELKGRLAAVVQGEDPPDAIGVTNVPGAGRFICTLPAMR
jgi:hypothetical protein